jgi:hypothetical protein
MSIAKLLVFLRAMRVQIRDRLERAPHSSPLQICLLARQRQLGLDLRDRKFIGLCHANSLLLPKQPSDHPSLIRIDFHHEGASQELYILLANESLNACLSRYFTIIISFPVTLHGSPVVCSLSFIAATCVASVSAAPLTRQRETAGAATSSSHRSMPRAGSTPAHGPAKRANALCAASRPIRTTSTACCCTIAALSGSSPTVQAKRMMSRYSSSLRTPSFRESTCRSPSMMALSGRFASLLHAASSNLSYVRADGGNRTCWSRGRPALRSGRTSAWSALCIRTPVQSRHSKLAASSGLP